MKNDLLHTQGFLNPKIWTLIGRGGEHLVYQLDYHLDVVFKLSIPYLEKTIKYCRKNKKMLDHLPSPFLNASTVIIEKEEKRHRKLSTYFEGHVLDQQISLSKIPLLPEVVRRWELTEEETKAAYCWALVTIQEYEVNFEDGKYLSLSSGFAEGFYQMPGYYRQINQKYLYQHHLHTTFNGTKFFKVQRSPRLKRLVTHLSNDQTLKAQVKHLIETIISYSNETDELLDLGPKDNIILFKTLSGWDYSLVDAAFPLKMNSLGLARRFLKQVHEGQLVNAKKMRFLALAINVIRMVNAMADICSIPDRIDITDDKMKQNPIDLGSLFQSVRVMEPEKREKSVLSKELI